MPTPSRSAIRRFSRGRVLAILAAGLLAGLDRADASGLIVSWDRCGDGRVANRAFTCDTNVGTDTLVVSFLAPFNFPKLAHADIFLYVCFQGFKLPDWWRVLGAGGCRSGALTVTAVSPGAGCTPIWDPVGGSTQTVFETGHTILNGFEFMASVSVGDSARARDIVAGQEFELTRLVLGHTRTTGPGACQGCAIGAVVGADFVWLYTTDGHNVGTSGESYVTWQDTTTVCRAISPVRNRTWGSIKSQYR